MDAEAMLSSQEMSISILPRALPKAFFLNGPASDQFYKVLTVYLK